MEKLYKFYAGLFALASFGLSSIAGSQAAIDNQLAKNDKVLAKLRQIRAPFVAQTHKPDQKPSFFAHTLWGTVQVSRSDEIDYVLTGCDLQGENCLAAPSVLKESLVSGSTKQIQGERVSSARVGIVQKGGLVKRLPAYEQLNFGDIYPGIKLTLEATAGNVEKVFTVSPKGDPKHIRLRLTGGKLKTNGRGELEIETANKDPVVFSRPIAYQEINGQRQEVEVAYRLISSHEYGFSLGPYDKTKPLIIDPVLVARNFGGSSLALDAQGNVYVVNTVTEPYGYRTDGYIAKFDSDLTGVLAAVYFGGSNYDYLTDIALDAQGNAYVVGYGYSTDLPTTPGAYDQTHNGGTDVFVAKLTPDLSTVLASTFLGGTPHEFGRAIVVDEGSGDVVIAGEVGSKGSPSKPATSNFPTTPSAFDRTISGTCTATFKKTLCPTAAFVSRFDSNLSQLKASTLLDGASSERVYALAIAGDGDIYATGTTKSSAFPTTAGAYDTSFNGASGGAWYTTYYLIDPRGDVFVARLDSLLTALKASTFLGGSGVEQAYAIVLDPLGNVFVAGGTDSNNLPVTPGAFQTVAPGSNQAQATIGRKDGFLAKLDENLTQLQAATYLGGGGSDSAYAVLIDRDAVLVGGGSGSGDFFTSPSGNYAAYPFVARLDETSLSLVEGEVLPSLGSGAINDLRLATDGAVYAVTEAWVAKLGSVDLAISISDAPDPVAVGGNLSYSVSVANYGPYKAQNVSVSFSLPDLTHFTFVAATSSQGNCSFTGTALSCNLGTLEANASAMIQVTVTPTQAGMLVMGVQVQSPEPDRDLTNNSASASTTVEGGNAGGGGNGGAPGTVDLVVSASDSPDPAWVNAQVTYQLTVTNRGSAQATGVVLTHTFQDSIAVDSIQSSQGNCSFSAQILSCALGGLAPNASASVQIVVRYLADGGMTSFVEASAQEADTNPDDNQVEVGTEVLAN